ncbi:MAG: hypothetical protein AAF441_15740 [Pseudomonadota bacterium]
MFDLYAAIFGSVLRARTGVERLVQHDAAFASSLQNLTLFLRTGEHAVEVGLLQLDTNSRVINVPKGALDVPMFRQFMPKEVSWAVIQSSGSEKHSTENLSSDFVSYLDVMIHLQSCCLLFVPPGPKQASAFLDGMSGHVQALLHTQISDSDLQTLRAFLVRPKGMKSARSG